MPVQKKLLPPEQIAFNKAEELFNKRMWVDAERAFTKFRSQNPKHVLRFLAGFRIGQCQRQCGNIAKALSTWQALAKDVNAKNEAPEILGRVYELMHIVHVNQKTRVADRRMWVSHAFANLPDHASTAKLYAQELAQMLVENEKPAVITAFMKNGPGKLPEPWGRVVAALAKPEKPETLVSVSPHCKLVEDVGKVNLPAAESLCRMLNNPPGLSLSLTQNALLAMRAKNAQAVAAAYAATRKAWPEKADMIDFHHGGVLIEVLQDAALADAQCGEFLKAHPKSGLREQVYLRWIHLARVRDRQAALAERIDGYLAAFPKARDKAALEEERGKALKTAEARVAEAKKQAEQQAARKAASAAEDGLTKARKRADELRLAGKHSEAGKLYGQVLKNVQHSEWPAAQHGLALCLRGMGRCDDALAAFDALLNRLEMVKDDAWKESQEKLPSIVLMMKAEMLLEEMARPLEAFQTYKAVLALRGEEKRSAELDWGLALSAVACGEKTYAFTLLSEMKENPKNTPLHSQRIARLLLHCDPAGQLPNDHIVVRSFRSGGEAFRAAEIFFLADEPGKALPYFTELSRRHAGTETGDFCSFRAGQCLAGLGRHREAVSHLENFAKRRPQSHAAPDALLLCATISTGPLDNAKAGGEFLGSVRRQWPQSDAAQTALLYLATLAYWEKAWDRANALHREYLAQYPDSPNNDFIRDHRLPRIAARGK